MKKRIVYFAVIFVLLPWGSNAYALPTDLAPYFNLTAGRTLAYDNFVYVAGAWVPDGSIATSIVSLGSGLKGELEYELPSGTLVNDFGVWSLEADGHHWVGEYDIPAARLDYASPFPGPVDGMMEVGELVTFDFWQFVEGVWQGPRRVEETFLGISPFTTPAGTFTDSAWILIEMYEGGVLTETSIWIWANGVGLIFELVLFPDGTPEDFSILVDIIP